MSIQPYTSQNQTGLVPQTLLGYSTNGQSAIEINPTSITIAGDLNTATPIYVGISASTGLTTNRVGGLFINCELDMNTNTINNVNNISSQNDLLLNASGYVKTTSLTCEYFASNSPTTNEITFLSPSRDFTLVNDMNGNGQNIIQINDIQLNTINGLSPTTIGLTWGDFTSTNAYNNLPTSSYELDNSFGLTSHFGVADLTINNLPNSASTILNYNKLTFNDTTSSPSIELTSGDLRISSDNSRLLLNSGVNELYIGDMFGAGGFPVISFIPNDYSIRTKCNDDIAEYSGQNYIKPVFYTTLLRGSISANGGTWNNIITQTLNMPTNQIETTNFVAWRLDFVINCWNMSNQTDKALAMYVEIIDGNSTIYTPYVFNLNEPYTTHKNNSTYSNTNNSVENYGWTDFFELSPTLTSPMTLNVYMYLDNNLSCDYKGIFTLSRNNKL